MSKVHIPSSLPEGKNYTKEQHQIFQGYFRVFSNTSRHNNLTFLDKNTGAKTQVRAASATALDHFYEVSEWEPNYIEDTFSYLENSWATSLRKLKNEQDLDEMEYGKLVQFAYGIGCKTEEAVDRMSEILELAKDHHDGFSYREDYLKGMLPLMFEGTKWWADNGTNGFWSSQVVESSDSFYLSSDRPVIFGDMVGGVMRPQMAVHYGPSSIVFPVTESKLFVAYIGEFPEEIVANHNQIQLWLARDYIIVNKGREEAAQKIITSSERSWYQHMVESDYLGLPFDEPYIISNEKEGTTQEIFVVRVVGEESEYYWDRKLNEFYPVAPQRGLESPSREIFDFVKRELELRYEIREDFNHNRN